MEADLGVRADLDLWSRSCGRKWRSRFGVGCKRLLSSTIWKLGRSATASTCTTRVAFWIRPMVMDRPGWFPNREPLEAIGTLAVTVGLAAPIRTRLNGRS